MQHRTIDLSSLRHPLHPRSSHSTLQVTTLHSIIKSNKISSQILETQNAVLSNYEVLTHLNDLQARYKDHPDYKHRTIKDFKGDNKQVVGKLNGLRLVVGDVSDLSGFFVIAVPCLLLFSVCLLKERRQ